MLPSAFRKSTGAKDERSVTFSRENSYIDDGETESYFAAAALNVEKEIMKQVDKNVGEGETETDGGTLHQDEDETRKGKKFFPSDSLKRHRERLSSKNEDWIEYDEWILLIDFS